MDDLQVRLDARFDDPALFGSRCRTVRTARSIRRWSRTSGSSSSATPCSGLVVTDYMFRRYPLLPEGELAKIRASVVNAEVLAEVAKAIDLGPALLLGKGEDASGGRAKMSILSDALEAVIAAVYLDGGWETAQRVVLALLEARIDAAAAGPGEHDYKSLLQELAARRFERLPRYQVRDEGPDHAKQFFATVLVGGVARGEGEGRSKKQAEQAAAAAAWAWLRNHDTADVVGTNGAGGHDAGVA